MLRLLCECVFHDFRHKLLLSSGEVFSEHASRYQTRVMSLEAQNILEVPLKGLSSMWCVYFVWMWISTFRLKLLFSSGEVFSEQASLYQTSVVSLEAQNILEVPFIGLSSTCCVYLCECVFHDFDHNCCFRRERSSRHRRVDIRRVWCHWKHRTS